MSISRNGLHILKSVGLVRTPTVEVLFSCSSETTSVTYSFQVFNALAEYNIDAVNKKLTTMLPTSGYVICPGLSNYPDNLRYDIKGVRKWEFPFERIDNVSCHLFHIPDNSKIHPLHTLYNDPCKKLQNSVIKWEQRNTCIQHDVSKHLMPSSNYPICLLWVKK